LVAQNSSIHKYQDIVAVQGAALNTNLFDTEVGLFTYGFLELSGTFNASVQLQGTLTDGQTWFNIPYTNTAANTYSTQAITAGGQYLFPLFVGQVRARITAYTSGTVIASVGFGCGPVPFDTAIGAAATSFPFQSAASTNTQLIAAGARKLYGFGFQNLTATPAFVKLYNKASVPVLASDIPVAIIQVPANGASPVFSSVQGRAFPLGIAFACTGLLANADATATAAGQIIGYVDYI
jgi:hypothetical protein